MAGQRPKGQGNPTEVGLPMDGVAMSGLRRVWCGGPHIRPRGDTQRQTNAVSSSVWPAARRSRIFVILLSSVASENGLTI